MAVPSGTKASFIECRIALDGDLSGSGGLNTAASVIDNNIRRASRSRPRLRRPINPKKNPGSKTCGKPCHLPSSAGNTVTMGLATVNDENPCGDRGLDAVCPPVALDGTDGEKWRRRDTVSVLFEWLPKSFL